MLLNMYTLLIIFYGSFIGIILMLLLKRREFRTGHPTVVSRIGSGTDRFFHALFSSIGRFFSYWNKRTLVALFHWAAFHLLKWGRSLYVEAKHRIISTPQGKKLLDAVRGRGEVRKDGASFYLRRIADQK